MRDPKEGVALAAIVAKETTEGKWSGTGGGLGFGTGGLGLFVGGMSGTKREQSQRAKDFEAPPKASFNWLYVFGPFIALLVVALLFKFGASFSEFMSDTAPSHSGSLSGPQANLGEFVSVLGTWVPVLVILAAVVWFFFGRASREREEQARFKRAEAADKAKGVIYHRLRYVEADHVVFDPKTGKEVPAERDHILSLLSQLASEERQ
ncbi:hypothetical protein CTQ51_13455 [Salmonella enterica subsp. enterica serovar Infantis]|nr:hypothetical protein [Salmonella enterica subsp. enterica serovar Infantis]EEC5280307.1 hypothetical protein [Salmonella enterica subsp. enterica serovar Potsdam]EET8237120.1 hypothetical protein [Escherichia coli]EIS1140247.1 hypothetical protein [Salmonella enterica]EDL8717212.1 hypothetical protein [Salmonella enterica subsp. enterica serovar Infantis]